MKKKKINRSRLNLNQQTLRLLAEDQLPAAVGGIVTGATEGDRFSCWFTCGGCV